MSFPIAKARADTPGAEAVAHFNNAGAALMPKPVIDCQHDHIQREAMCGGYEAAAAAAERIAAVYGSVARLIGASADEIAIVENATTAWDMVFYALPFAPGDRILTSRAEYAANFVAYLQVCKRTGAQVEIIPCTGTGEIGLDALETMIDARAKLIAITHVPTNGGLVNPAAGVGRIARAHGIPYLLDACQSVGQMPIDVGEIGCDMLSATSRKYLRGPRGVGFLYVRRALAETLEPPIIDHHAAEWVAADRYRLRPGARRFENWESNIAAVLGLGAAVDYALSWGMGAVWERISELGAALRHAVESVPGAVVHDIGSERCGIVSLSLADHTPAHVKAALAREAINVSVSTPASTLLDAAERGLGDVVRASVHYYNTGHEIDRLVATLRALD